MESYPRKGATLSRKSSFPGRRLLSGVGNSWRELFNPPDELSSLREGEKSVGDLEAASAAAQQRSVHFPLPESPSQRSFYIQTNKIFSSFLDTPIVHFTGKDTNILQMKTLLPKGLLLRRLGEAGHGDERRTPRRLRSSGCRSRLDAPGWVAEEVGRGQRPEIGRPTAEPSQPPAQSSACRQFRRRPVCCGAGC